MVQVGDWVRFYQGGKLVTGVVEFVGLERIGMGVLLSTDIGAVYDKSVLEVRPPQVKG